MPPSPIRAPRIYHTPEDLDDFLREEFFRNNRVRKENDELVKSIMFKTDPVAEEKPTRPNDPVFGSW